MTQALAHTPRKIKAYDQTASLVFFPDGERAMHVSQCGLATLLQVGDGKRMGSWMKAACVATVSKDGRWVVCGCSDGKLRVWDAAETRLEALTTTAIVETNDHHTHKVSALDVSTDSSTVASGSSDGSVIVWSVATGQRLAGPLHLDHGQVQGKVSSVCFAVCGSRLACGTNILNPSNQHGSVHVLDIHDDQLTSRVVVTFNSCLTAISWSHGVDGPDQPRILVGLEDSLAAIDPSHGPSDSRHPIPGFRILSKNGKFLVSGTWQDGVRFWDAAMFTEIGPNLPSCFPLAISPADNNLVCLSRNTERCALFIWNLSDILPKRYTVNVCSYFFSLGEIP